MRQNLAKVARVGNGRRAQARRRANDAGRVSSARQAAREPAKAGGSQPSRDWSRASYLDLCLAATLGLGFETRDGRPISLVLRDAADQ